MDENKIVKLDIKHCWEYCWK